jgi:alanyl-tRNA synthetase
MTVLFKEASQFKTTLIRGKKNLKKFIKNISVNDKTISGDDAFDFYATHGLPIEFVEDLANEEGYKIDKEGFEASFQKHKDMSRQGAEKKFKGGLADSSEETTKLHTATHLLHQALRNVLGNHVEQKGSNITAERLRFDFSHTDKVTPEQLQEVETIVNEQIKKSLPIQYEELTVDEAKAKGAIGLFEHKYGEKVKVYSIGDGENNFSTEICGGPHVQNTSELKSFKIKKEESSSKGVRRIKAIVG